LLKEYEQSAKSSQFVDKRIGEHDDSLKEYEKAILRLQKERMVCLYSCIHVQLLLFSVFLVHLITICIFLLVKNKEEKQVQFV
jgi:Nop14-like family